jgi:hypothetical protein
MAEKPDPDETAEWSDLEWKPPDEELDHVLVPVEGDTEVDPGGLEPPASCVPRRRSPS